MPTDKEICEFLGLKEDELRQLKMGYCGYARYSYYGNKKQFDARDKNIGKALNIEEKSQC